ncbi:hypothetical protein, partial [Mesorhizobium japonicum]|uniref:hypothetical protein n=1 Tax=Mesorhizobium japonicum TaxID=2066070 RepID=UPI003B5B92DE
KYLKWSVQGEQLTVENTGPYVVRLSDQVALLPATQSLALGQSYLMAQSKKTFALPKNLSAPVTGVRIQPITLYGFSLHNHDFMLSPR